MSVSIEYDRFVQASIKISRGIKCVKLTLVVRKNPTRLTISPVFKDGPRGHPTVATATRHSSLSWTTWRRQCFRAAVSELLSRS